MRLVKSLVGGALVATLVVPVAVEASSSSSNAATAKKKTERVSVSTTEEQGDGHSEVGHIGSSDAARAISTDGRFVVFQSLASNFRPGDTDGRNDAFVRDRELGTTDHLGASTRIGAPGRMGVTISPDGALAAFRSGDESLLPPPIQDDGFSCECLFYIGTDFTSALPPEPIPVLNEEGHPVIPANSFSLSNEPSVAFVPTDHVVGTGADQNGAGDIVVKSLTGGFDIIQDYPDGGCPDGGDPRMSADGRYVAFIGPLNLNEDCLLQSANYLWVIDRTEGEVELASVASDDTPVEVEPRFFALSDDGRTAVFVTRFADEGAGDFTEGDDVFARDLDTDSTELVSVRPNGSQFLYAGWPTVSGNGEMVAFIAPKDQFVSLWIRDRHLQTTTHLVSGKDGGVIRPSLTSDGTTVVFDSGRDNLIKNDTNKSNDVFVFEFGDKVRLRGRVTDGRFNPDGHAEPLEGARVELRQGSDVLYGPEAVAPDGTYQFDNVVPGEYDLRVTLEDSRFRDPDFEAGVGEPVFDIRYTDTAAEPVWIAVPVELEGLTEKRDVAFSAGESFDATAPGVDPTRLDDMAALFRSFVRYLAWIREALPDTMLEREEIGSTLPVEVYAFSAAINPINAVYHAGRSDINMGTDVSRYAQRDGDRNDRGPSIEWHEFTHHLWITNLYTGACPGSNHGGYDNPSTCDSMNEGLAAFLPTAALSAPDGGPLNYLDEDSNYLDAYDGFLGVFFEDNRLDAWGTQQVQIGNVLINARREEFAVAALLWDLVDDRPDGEYIEVIGADNEHAIPFVDPGAPGSTGTPGFLSEQVSVPLATLWPLMRGDFTQQVRDVWEALRFGDGIPAEYREVVIDLDSNGTADVAPIDVPFLLHGFYPIRPDELAADHSHYDVDSGTLFGITGSDANRAVGYSTHAMSPTSNRRATERLEGAEVVLDVMGPKSSPVSGATVTITLGYPGEERVLRLPVVDGTVSFYLELPPHYLGYLPEGETAPDCTTVDEDAAVEVTIEASLGAAGADEPISFDNCDYAEMLLAPHDDQPVIEETLEVPAADTRITLKLRKKSKRVTARGALTPGNPGEKIRLRYETRKRGRGRWRRVATKRPVLGDLFGPNAGGNFRSLFETRFKRAGKGKCRIVASWAGTATHRPSKATKAFKC